MPKYFNVYFLAKKDILIPDHRMADPSTMSILYRPY